MPTDELVPLAEQLLEVPRELIRRIIAVFSMPSFIAMASAVLNPIPRISRARRYGFSVITWMASAP